MGFKSDAKWLEEFEKKYLAAGEERVWQNFLENAEKVKADLKKEIANRTPEELEAHFKKLIPTVSEAQLKRVLALFESLRD